MLCVIDNFASNFLLKWARKLKLSHMLDHWIYSRVLRGKLHIWGIYQEVDVNKNCNTQKTRSSCCCLSLLNWASAIVVIMLGLSFILVASPKPNERSLSALHRSQDLSKKQLLARLCHEKCTPSKENESFSPKTQKFRTSCADPLKIQHGVAGNRKPGVDGDLKCCFQRAFLRALLSGR